MKKYIISLFLFATLSQYAFSLENKILSDKVKFAEPKLDLNSFEGNLDQSSEKQVEISDSQLENNKLLIEHFLNLAIDEQQESVIPDLLKMYQKHKYQDPILREYALGTYHHSIRDYQLAINIYTDLLKKNPELVKVRFKLAQWLLEDHQYYSSNQQLSTLKNSELPDFIQQRIALYQDLIKLRQEPKFKLRLSYIQDNNINNASSEQYITLGKTRFKKQSESLPQKTQGLNYHFNIDKTHNVTGNHNIYIENELSGKYYWNNKKYNEKENNFYIGYQYQNVRNRLAVLPFYNYQWLSQKRYSYAIGNRIEFDRQLAKSWQFSSVVEFDKTNYKNSNRTKYKQLYSTTLMYINRTNRYLLIGADVINERLPFKRDSSIRYSARLGVQQIWQNNIVLNMNLQYAKRYFRGDDYFTNYKRKDNEWVFSTMLSNNDWHILGFIPKLQYRYQKIDSNIPEFFSFNKQQVNLFFEKKF